MLFDDVFEIRDYPIDELILYLEELFLSEYAAEVEINPNIKNQVAYVSIYNDGVTFDSASFSIDKFGVSLKSKYLTDPYYLVESFLHKHRYMCIDFVTNIHSYLESFYQNYLYPKQDCENLEVETLFSETLFYKQNVPFVVRIFNNYNGQIKFERECQFTWETSSSIRSLL